MAFLLPLLLAVGLSSTSSAVVAAGPPARERRYGDNYERWRDGQYIDVTGVPAGRYHLLYRVNVGRRLRGTRYENNVSSLLVQLSWPRGMSRLPRLTVLARCPDSTRCSG